MKYSTVFLFTLKTNDKIWRTSIEKTEHAIFQNGY